MAEDLKVHQADSTGLKAICGKNNPNYIVDPWNKRVTCNNCLKKMSKKEQVMDHYRSKDISGWFVLFLLAVVVLVYAGLAWLLVMIFV